MITSEKVKVRRPARNQFLPKPSSQGVLPCTRCVEESSGQMAVHVSGCTCEAPISSWTYFGLRGFPLGHTRLVDAVGDMKKVTTFFWKELAFCADIAMCAVSVVGQFGLYRCVRKKRPPRYFAVKRGTHCMPQNMGRNAYRYISLYIARAVFLHTPITCQTHHGIIDEPFLQAIRGTSIINFAQRS